MSELPRDAVCRNCRRPFPAGELDAYAWCAECRAIVIRRATIAGWVVGALAALATGALVFGVLRPGSRSLILWLIVEGAVFAVAYKVTQRVAFEVIRSRGVPPPES